LAASAQVPPEALSQRLEAVARVWRRGQRPAEVAAPVGRQQAELSKAALQAPVMKSRYPAQLSPSW
jgi:hypothetical protein